MGFIGLLRSIFSDPQTVGLVFDVWGAYLLSRGFIFKRIEEIEAECYGHDLPNGREGLGMSGNLARSMRIQGLEARFGFIFLFLGFMLQGLGQAIPLCRLPPMVSFSLVLLGVISSYIYIRFQIKKMFLSS